MSDLESLEPTFDDIEDAAERLDGVAIRTPLIESSELNARTGGRILLKAECLQRTGSFKFRGAYNTISQLTAEERRNGVLAWSSGNHAQGVAAAAGLLNAPATIVMPSDAPAIKIENTKHLGAEVVLYDRYTESREDIGTALAKERGMTIVRPYDDVRIIAGQGTAGLEIDEQCQELGTEPDALLVNCGGGGLTAGCSIALTEVNPAIEIYCVEPAGYDDHARSLIDGRRVENSMEERSICDALLAPAPGEITFAINRQLLSGGLAVTDEEVKAAVRFAFQHLKLVVEPGGAASLAAILAGKIDCKGRTVCAILTGGNVTNELFSKILSES